MECHARDIYRIGEFRPQFRALANIDVIKGAETPMILRALTYRLGSGVRVV